MKKLMFVVTFALAASVALAEGPQASEKTKAAPRGPRPNPAMMMDPILHMVNNPLVAQTLNLTEEQQAKLKELAKAPREGSRETQEKMRAATEKQFKLMSEAKIDEAAVMAAIDEVFELRKAQAKDQAKRLIAVRSVLTQEQIEKAMSFMRSRNANRVHKAPAKPGEKPAEKPADAPVAPAAEK